MKLFGGPKVYSSTEAARKNPGRGKEWQQIAGGGYIKVNIQPRFDPNEILPPNLDAQERYESTRPGAPRIVPQNNTGKNISGGQALAEWERGRENKG